MRRDWTSVATLGSGASGPTSSQRAGSDRARRWSGRLGRFCTSHHDRARPDPHKRLRSLHLVTSNPHCHVCRSSLLRILLALCMPTVAASEVPAMYAELAAGTDVHGEGGLVLPLLKSGDVCPGTPLEAPLWLVDYASAAKSSVKLLGVAVHGVKAAQGAALIKSELLAGQPADAVWLIDVRAAEESWKKSWGNPLTWKWAERPAAVAHCGKSHRWCPVPSAILDRTRPGEVPSCKGAGSEYKGLFKLADLRQALTRGSVIAHLSGVTNVLAGVGRGPDGCMRASAAQRAEVEEIIAAFSAAAALRSAYADRFCALAGAQEGEGGGGGGGEEGAAAGGGGGGGRGGGGCG